MEAFFICEISLLEVVPAISWGLFLLTPKERKSHEKEGSSKLELNEIWKLSIFLK
jgi:hypothetical protein